MKTYHKLMNKASAQKRAKLLRERLEKYRYEYYQLDKPSVSDAVYDSLNNELKKIEEKFLELTSSASPTQVVGGKADKRFSSVEHKKPMLSLQDVFSLDELE